MRQWKREWKRSREWVRERDEERVEKSEGVREREGERKKEKVRESEWVRETEDREKDSWRGNEIMTNKKKLNQPREKNMKVKDGIREIGSYLSDGEKMNRNKINDFANYKWKTSNSFGKL